MSALNELGLAEARDGLKAKDFSAKEMAEACLAAMERARALNAFVLETPEKALAMAAQADTRLSAGKARPLEGVPIGVKDLYCTKGVETTAGSGILKGFKPEYESAVTQQLWDAGAVMLGKLNMDEFAMGSSNETSVFGPAVNPWKAKGDDARRSPGGSSGGSSAAVAARLCPGATASDTGGSIRQPAAFTGTVGVKPTYGRASRWGMVAFASSLDQAGPITRSVRDAALMLTHMCAHDEKDSTSLDVETPDWETLLDGGVKGMRIGIPKEYRMEGTPEPILELWDRGVAWLKAAGAEVAEISLPHTEYGLPAYYVIAPAEASSNLARYDGVRYGQRVEGKDLIEMYENTRGKGFGKEVQRRILIGAYALSAGYYDAYYLKALKVRRRVADDFKQAFEKVDLILTPTTPNAAFPIGQPLKDPIQMYLNDVFTVAANLAGLPAISVPAGLDAQGLPLGLHLIGKPLDEATMFKGALALEEAAGFDAKPQAWWAA